MKIIISAALASALLPGVCARTFTIHNACPFTIWYAPPAIQSRPYFHQCNTATLFHRPALFTDPKVGQNFPNFQTGWEAAANTQVSFAVPENWRAGRIWGRRNCDFSTDIDADPGPNSCLDGGCNGGLLCDSFTGTGVPPATVAEWTLSGDGNRDFYDGRYKISFSLPRIFDVIPARVRLE